MRPHKLQFGGIGTYPKDTEIDFDALSTLGLYLIVGPTGAGKSTIFDALTYALYGKVAGERPEGTIVSDHANRVTPYVNLEFTHRNTRYRVQRKPSTDTKSPKPGDQVFIEYNADGSENRRDTGMKKVTDEIVNLVGLDAEQFMRVILLPQNEFRQFLLANSNDKVSLLRALFGTGMYETIASRLDNSAKEFNIAARDAELAVDFQEDTAKNAMNALLNKQLIEAVPEDFDISTYINVVLPRSDSATARAQHTLLQLTDAVAAATNAQNEANRFDAAQERETVQLAITNDAESVARATQMLENHKRAVAIVPFIEQQNEKDGQVSNSQTSLAESREQLVQQLTNCAQECTLTLRSLAINESAEKLNQEINDAMATLSVFEGELKRVDVLRTTFAEQTIAYGNAEQTLEQLNQQLSELQTKLPGMERAVENALQAQSDLVAVRALIDDLESKLATSDVEAAQAELKRSSLLHQAADNAFQQAAAELSVAISERTRHLAGELAATLHDNCPCPVCGSTAHPAKAVPTSDADPTQLQESRDVAHSALLQCEAAVQLAQTAVEGAKAVAATLPPVQEQESLRQSFAKVTALAATLDSARAELKECEDAIKELNRLAGTAMTKRDTAFELITNAERDLENVDDVPDGLTSEKVEQEKQILRDALDLVVTLSKHEKQLNTATASASQAAETVKSMLEAASLSSAEQAFDLVLDEQALSAHESVIQDNQRRDDKLKTLNGRIGTDPIPTIRPDTEMLQATADAATLANSEASDEAALLKTKLEELQQVQRDLLAIGPEADQARVRAREAQSMADVIRKGEKGRLSLEKWVQRTLFDEVCDVASVQIATLSSGRYRLTLQGDGQKSGKKSEGLDIFVIDSHTGKTRAVQTLSGGEQFLTSLALALALAEVVQRHSGGIEMSSLFIDEGFGSLDADNLEIAVDVLRSLQDSGRTVGVISHVESMQQELNVGIRVTRSPAGSSLEVLV
jgi:exonuclease SbcC